MNGWVGYVGWHTADGLPRGRHPSTACQGAGQGKFAGHRPTFYHCATPSTYAITDANNNANGVNALIVALLASSTRFYLDSRETFPYKIPWIRRRQRNGRLRPYNHTCRNFVVESRRIPEGFAHLCSLHQGSCKSCSIRESITFISDRFE